MHAHRAGSGKTAQVMPASTGGVDGRSASPRPSSLPPDRRSSRDADGRAWIAALHADGAVRDEAVGRLHALLLRAARFEAARRSAALRHVRGSDLDDIALQAADDALVAVLAKLDAFRGDSRFSTWAYKFALFEAAVALRRRAWQGREVPLAPERWAALGDLAASCSAAAEQREQLDAIGRAIARELTPHQREVLVAITLNEVPIDILAQRLRTTRGALYKTLHDARQKLRRALAADGWAIEGDTHGARP
jgi:RNA polymerase sigma-70 factor (ECF subfamily)